MNVKELLNSMEKYKKLEEEIEFYENIDLEYLTKDDLIFIHDSQISQFGGIYGVRDEGLLDSVSKGPYQEIFGEELYPSIFDKAAKYLYDFSTYQIFLDGNKRIGLSASTLFLEINDYELDMSFKELYDLTMSVANGKINEIKDISNIFSEKSIKIEKLNESELERE